MGSLLGDGVRDTMGDSYPDAIRALMDRGGGFFPTPEFVPSTIEGSWDPLLPEQPFLTIGLGTWYFHATLRLTNIPEDNAYGFEVIGGPGFIGDYRTIASAFPGQVEGFRDSTAVVGPLTLTGNFFLVDGVSSGLFEMQATRLG